MATRQEIEEWQRLRFRLVAVSESLREFLTENERFAVWDFVDHDEQGIAYDTLLAALLKTPGGSAKLSAEHVTTLPRLGKAMDYTPDSDEFYREFLATYHPQI